MYKAQFEVLSNRIKDLSSSHKLSCFLSGLKDEIRLPVRMLNPQSLNEAFGLSKIQEEYHLSYKKNSRLQLEQGKPSILGLPKVPSLLDPKSRLPIQRISPVQMEDAMSNPPMLALPNFTKPFTVECAASGLGLRVVLLQSQRPIAFHSQALKGKNLALSTYEKELLALVVVVKKWRPYLLGRLFVIKIDHQSLKYLLEQRVGTPT